MLQFAPDHPWRPPEPQRRLRPHQPGLQPVRGRARVVLLAAGLAGGFALVSGAALLAQGVTTGSVRGTVRVADGSDPDDIRVTIRHAGTGFVVETAVRDGRFLLQGLEIGGPYTITLERLGLRSERREGLWLTLGEPLELRFMMRPAAIEVEPLHVRTTDALPRANVHGGTATIVTDSLLHRLPTLNRNLYDLVSLAPQVSTRIGFGQPGMSGGGVGFRFNNFLVDGVPERQVTSNQPPEFAAGRSLPFEAVSEYQVLVAPFDVRYGDFAGALVNAVTRSGTNHLRGSLFASWRDDGLARQDDLVGGNPFERWQYGFSVGGPIRRNRAHYFLAGEVQRQTSPAPGPFLGQPEGARPPVPVTEDDLAELTRILASYDLAAGSAGQVPNRNPLSNLFGRVDVGVPEWNSRLVLRGNAARTRELGFSRLDRASFPLSSHAAIREFATHSGALHLHTTLPRRGGGHNELVASHRSLRAEFQPAVRQPIVEVDVPGASGGAVTLVAGTPAVAQGGATRIRSTLLRDDLTIPLKTSHVGMVGFQAEWFHSDAFPLGVPNAFGTWTFSSLDSLRAGVPRRYEVARDFGGATVPISGGHYAVYAGDRWRASQRLSITAGLRADWLVTRGRAPYEPSVDSVFGRRTDRELKRPAHLSPRLGFTWDLGRAGRHRVRGGAGVFTGRPPVAWLHAPLRHFGVGTGVLRCGSLPGDLGPPPPFDPDHADPPRACADGSGLTVPPRGNVELLHPRLRLAQTLRAVLAYDRRLPWDLIGTVEGLVTRNISDFAFVNLNLGEPVATDRQGRTLYGSIEPSGIARPALRDETFPAVVELRNTSRNHSHQLSARLEKRFASGLGGSASYTYSRVRDVQTPLRINVPGLVNWSSRAVSGRHDDTSPGVSLNDVPHRVVLAGTYRTPWRRWATELSFLYVGQSGSPFTYRSRGSGGRGDLNADGSNANDPIYVPRDATDPDEIAFSGGSDTPGADNSPSALAERVSRQQVAFERFIEGSACLRRQRGSILRRNSCREPWSQTTLASLRQAIPVPGGSLSVQVDAFNLLNLLDGDWGHRRLAAPAVLEHVGQTGELPEEAQPIFRFDAAAPRWITLPEESAFQLQFAVRYTF